MKSKVLYNFLIDVFVTHKKLVNIMKRNNLEVIKMDDSGRRYANNDWCYEQCRRGRCRGVYHMIRQGDTLYGLSRQYRVSVDAIMRANPGVNIYNLHINDELCIPVMMNNRPMQGTPMPGMPRPEMPMNNMPMNNNMPLDFTFEYIEDDLNNSGMQREFSMFDDGMVEMESKNPSNYFSENDSVKEMLEKIGMSMEELLGCINRR